MQKLLRIIGSIVAAIVLGAIGSGLWEKVLSPLLSSTSAATVAFISGLSSSYEDSIYQRAARDVSDLYTIKIAFLIFVVAGFVLVALVASRVVSNVNMSEHLRSRLHRVVGINALTFGLTLLALSFFAIAKVDAATQIKERSLRTLEILRPSVGEAEYFRLRSRYYSTESKADFVAFRELVLSHAARSGTKVPLAELVIDR